MGVRACVYCGVCLWCTEVTDKSKQSQSGYAGLEMDRISLVQSYSHSLNKQNGMGELRCAIAGKTSQQKTIDFTHLILLRKSIQGQLDGLINLNAA